MTDREMDDARMASTRLAAVQAAYEIDFADVTADDVLSAFLERRWNGADDEVEEDLAPPRPELLRRIVEGTVADQSTLDAVLANALTAGDSLKNLEAVLRALLRVAAYELSSRTNVPSRTVLSAYAGLSDAFFDSDGPQSKLIAGVLNAVARAVRPAEFEATVE